MKIDNAVVLVTGANRGIGLAFVQELLARGASKVYAAARDPATLTLPGVHALRLDVNNPDDVAAAAALATDVTLVINNAGIAQPGGILDADSEAVARRIFETNFFGMLRISKAFAPILAMIFTMAVPPESTSLPELNSIVWVSSAFFCFARADSSASRSSRSSSS